MRFSLEPNDHNDHNVHRKRSWQDKKKKKRNRFPVYIKSTHMNYTAYMYIYIHINIYRNSQKCIVFSSLILLDVLCRYFVFSESSPNNLV